ncbi:hypothetical protein [Sphingobacterium gobiense]|uniref:Uncharacterized protein n=1 Tax=Sphingobacterium gobiense TaxID=1382456 RepID=A0A2S9JV69_9SPHI|nr:hypothetical protein [Sphingobacterium gobiense]PRD57031.1 hypothetical protein C5749_07435 [Sphingobacterium gobiense]
MNFDKIKSAWDNDNTNDVNIPDTIEKLRRAQHPLDKLKRNMRNEWYMQLVSIIALCFAPQFLNIHPDLHALYYAMYGMLIIVSIYYLNLFRKFYQELIHYTAETKDSLNDIYYNFRLNIARYHAFSFLLLPYVLMVVGLIICSRWIEQGTDMVTIAAYLKPTGIIVTLVVSALFITAVPIWTRIFYGKYLTQIKSVLDELKEKFN